MTHDEATKILKILRLNYPNSFTKLSDDDTYDVLDMWTEAFKNVDGRLVVQAVKNYVYSSTEGFAPSIGMIKNMVMKLDPPKQKEVGEAWEIVIRNVRCNLQYAKENYNKLPRNIQKALGGFHTLSDIGYMNNDQTTFARKDFERNYTKIIEEEKEMFLSGLITKDQIELNNTQPMLLDEPSPTIRLFIKNNLGK